MATEPSAMKYGVTSAGGEDPKDANPEDEASALKGWAAPRNDNASFTRRAVTVAMLLTLMAVVLIAVLASRRTVSPQAAVGLDLEELNRSFPGAQQCAAAARQSRPAPVAATSPQESLALVESDGFFDEPDSKWRQRKLDHVHQMCLEASTLRTCPSTPGKECMFGCGSSLVYCLASTFWQIHYEPSFFCEHEGRIGNVGDGGKWVCAPHKIAAKVDGGGRCLVYSIGSHDMYDFEEAVHERISKGCEIHTFDKDAPKVPPPKYVSFHARMVGPGPGATPVPQLVRELGHSGRVIDIFKIDCEGCEWSTFKTWFSEGVYIRQILVELHYISNITIDFFRFLFDQGYVVFHKEPNMIGCNGLCIEYAFIRLSANFSHADSA